jgi:hypothetical protein
MPGVNLGACVEFGAGFEFTLLATGCPAAEATQDSQQQYHCPVGVPDIASSEKINIQFNDTLII